MSVLTAPPRPSTTGAASREARGAAVVAALALIASMIVAPPWRSSSLPPGQAAQLVTGSLERSVGDRWEAVRTGAFIAIGSRVRTPDERAVLGVEDGEIRLARGSEATLGRRTFSLDVGRVLVEVDAVVTGRLGGIAVEGRGAWRLDGGAAPRVGVYRGGAGVGRVDGDREVAVGRLQQVDLIDGAPAADAGPLRYQQTDPWDERLLAEAFAIDRQAAQLRTGLEAQYGTAPRSLDFYDDFAAVDPVTAAALPATGERAGDAFGPPADVLLAVVVVDLLTRGSALTAGEAVGEVVQLRQEGATYGIVLLRHDLGAEDLVDAFAVALTRRAQQVAANPQPTLAPSPTPSPAGGTDGGTTDGGTDGGTTGGQTDGGTDGGTTDGGSDGTVDEIVDGVVEVLPDPIQSPVADLTELLRDVADELPLPGLP